MARPPRLLTLIRQSLSSDDRDYTSLPVGQAVILLAVPMVLELLMESVFAITDVFWVSRLGIEAVATVGLIEAVLTLVYAVAGGLATATTATVARRIGEGDRDGAGLATVQSALLGLVLAVLVGVPGALLASRILGLMGADPATVSTGAGYSSVLLGGSGTVVMLFLLNAALRGSGDAASAMRILWIANGINLVLDPCLIFGLGPFPRLGVTGAAVATTLGRGIGVVCQLVLLARARGRLRPRAEHLRPRPKVIGGLLRISAGGVLQFLIATASWVAMMRIVSAFGAAAVAGYTIAIRVIIVSILPAWGIANAAATLVGQNLGAGRPDRAKDSTWRAGRANFVFLLGLGTAFLLGAELIVGLFTTDPEVAATGAACLRWIALGYPFYAYGMVIVQAFNGAGDTLTPTVVNLFCYWLLQIPLGWVLATGTTMAATGVFVAIAVSESTLAISAALLFRRGRWSAQRV